MSVTEDTTADILPSVHLVLCFPYMTVTHTWAHVYDRSGPQERRYRVDVSWRGMFDFEDLCRLWQAPMVAM